MKKAERKKNFHLGSFAMKKVKKVTKLRSGYAAKLPGGFYREDAKGSAAKSVRDRFTALLSDSS
ncbi:MAG: hypothetical protein IKZ27_00695 [Kiritimatiellae bacterium]|nr:hypothetical protein [Kiritimatiellia bacterium]